MRDILLYAGGFLYVLNYAVGWLLFFRKIRMSKRQHQFLYGSIVMVLIALMPILYGVNLSFAMLTFSLAMMIILPFGRKGSVYHRIVSTAGLIAFIIIFFV